MSSSGHGYSKTGDISQQHIIITCSQTHVTYTHKNTNRQLQEKKNNSETTVITLNTTQTWGAGGGGQRQFTLLHLIGTRHSIPLELFQLC